MNWRGMPLHGWIAQAFLSHFFFLSIKLFTTKIFTNTLVCLHITALKMSFLWLNLAVWGSQWLLPHSLMHHILFHSFGYCAAAFLARYWWWLHSHFPLLSFSNGRAVTHWNLVCNKFLKARTLRQINWH